METRFIPFSKLTFYVGQISDSILFWLTEAGDGDFDYIYK